MMFNDQPEGIIFRYANRRFMNLKTGITQIFNPRQDQIFSLLIGYYPNLLPLDVLDRYLDPDSEREDARTMRGQMIRGIRLKIQLTHHAELMILSQIKTGYRLLAPVYTPDPSHSLTGSETLQLQHFLKSHPDRDMAESLYYTLTGDTFSTH